MDNNKGLAELTIKAIVLGVLLSVVLASANAYLGLFAGMTVSASIPAAVMSMGILRLFKKSNILENNIVQTAASAGESLVAGVIFTLPALIIMGFWEDFSFIWVTIIAGFGGILGVLFTIPLRRSLIVEADLKFPEGIATAEVLETGQKGHGIKHLVQTACAGGIFKLGADFLGLWGAKFEVARRIGGSVAYLSSSLSPALFSVGFIVGLNIAILIFLGGAANWFIAIPAYLGFVDWPVHADGTAMNAAKAANAIWETKTRYLGVGAMVVGGLWAVIQMRNTLVTGIMSGLKAYRSDGGKTQEMDRQEKDMPMKIVLMMIMCSIVPLFLVYQVFVDDVSVSLPMALVMIGCGFVFSAVAGYMAGLVGSSSNPISGVTIATVLISSLLLLLLMGKSAEKGPPAAVIIGAVVACAAAIAGDNMQDLKAGRIVGATPWKQQVMQMVGVVSSALVIAPVLILLQNAYGFAGQPDLPAGVEGLAAPQANVMASVAKGVFEGGLPWNFLFAGMVIAVGIILCDLYLAKLKSDFRMPVLAVAIGFYLPLYLSVPILLGGIVSKAVKTWHRKRKSTKEQVGISARNGLLMASGLITGEALMGIFLAIPIVMLKGKKDLPFVDYLWSPVTGTVLLLGIAFWVYKVATAKAAK
ncbi:oligopeptide transporter, OPT family [Anaerohalosphaera lusitana]|uniref:Oligopeptide transporter, OPT family n=1 Tax=Anaerohalosphaera lusitana TaxID=1936003 RepID=A0A1U9NJ63_9BACT|nr:oligopeptide transporter, OPT family [Anaerohalosphaera lusitana]AQT67556.1 oligopeptide transporter, OPT family [Anaerohalosphaera lusitana]